MKHKVEKLCQCFENGAELVDLTDINPHVIANVLKLYMRQLPEPLLTFQYYQDFIRVAETYPAPPHGTQQQQGGGGPPSSSGVTSDLTPSQEEAVIAELKNLCRKLPRTHLFSLGEAMQNILSSHPI